MAIKPELAQIARDLQAHAAWLRENGADDLPVLRAASRPAPVPASSPAASKPPAREAPPVLTASQPATPATSPSASRTLPQIREDIGDCKRCRLCEGRTNIVYGVGNPQAELVFVGEGPGADEDLKGEPFVGRAGQLLDKMIEAMGLKRSE